MNLTQGQSDALAVILKAIERGQKVVRLSGAAGTGKTTLIKSIYSEHPYADICTPTNKAAQVLQAKSLPATTFYKKFYVLEETEDTRPRFMSYKKWLDLNRPEQEGKIEHTPLLLVDEATMVTTYSVRDMQRMCDTLVLVGDEHQLPPVGDRENPEGVFNSVRADATLTEVMRQAEGSLILTLAEGIRRGRPDVGKMLRHFEPQVEFAQLVEEGAQSICFTNKERQRINAVSRSILGRTSPYPVPGDRLIVTNNYSEDLINGTPVTVEEFELIPGQPYARVRLADPAGNRYTVRFNLHKFAQDQVASYRDPIEEAMRAPDPEEELGLEATFGYCLTAHKAQGSEWDKVIVFDQRSLVHKVQSNQLNAQMAPDEYVRRWLYTCITRARRELFVAPTWWAKNA